MIIETTESISGSTDLSAHGQKADNMTETEHGTPHRRWRWPSFVSFLPPRQPLPPEAARNSLVPRSAVDGSGGRGSASVRRTSAGCGFDDNAMDVAIFGTA
jgi:hypothetical protein